jgi:prepilin-type processing-associated H-X9-DG protein
MKPLNSEQKQLLFDYCIGLTSQEEKSEAEALISSNDEAAKIHSKIKSTLSPLTSIEPELCPDDLVERTVWRLKSLANSNQDRLQQLLASEQIRETAAQKPQWLGLGRRLATAAVIMIAGSILITSFRAVSGYARHHSQLQKCQMQQSGIFQGLKNYISDHDCPPTVATAAGAPWYKLGDQRSENHSNTRRPYLLVKGDYVDSDCFICPSCSKDDRPPKLTPSQIQTLKDFPDRKYISYSFQINCRGLGDSKLLFRKVLMADLSPLFEELPKDLDKPLKIRLNLELLTRNSINHKRRGQNVLFGDGHIEFLKTRFIKLSTDDIFTLQDTDVYQGCEVPSCETDFFLAP